MQFLCLAYEQEQQLAALSEREWEALRDETLAYVEELRSSGHLVDTRPLATVRSARTVRVRHDERLISDGPFAETKEQLGGFFLIEAADLDEAVRLAAGWPSARLGSIEVRPIMEMLPAGGRYQ